MRQLTKPEFALLLGIIIAIIMVFISPSIYRAIIESRQSYQEAEKIKEAKNRQEARSIIRQKKVIIQSEVFNIDNLPIKYLNYAKVLRDKYDNQIKEYYKNYLDNPTDINNLFNLAITYFKSVDIESTKKCFNKALSIDRIESHRIINNNLNKNEQTLNSLLFSAMYYLINNRIVEAKLNLEKIIEAQDDNEIALFYLACINYYQGDKEKAQEYYDKLQLIMGVTMD